MAAPAPIVMLAFNRPAYFYEVLASLLMQDGIRDRSVYLFQDGATNPHSGKTWAEQVDIDTNLSLFRAMIPWGEAMPAPHNLGIALNFDRAEIFAFDVLSVPAAVFLEDDMVLGRYYLKTLDRLLAIAVGNENMGYVSAYGNHKAALADQLRNRNVLAIMGQNWAFGLTRDQWMRQRPYVDQYLSILRKSDYRGRDHNGIIDLFHRWGLGAPGTSQDIAKSHAAILSSCAKVGTVACFGRYIGATGQHFQPEEFEAAGYGGTSILHHDLCFPAAPTETMLRTWIDTARKSAMVEAVTKK